LHCAVVWCSVQLGHCTTALNNQAPHPFQHGSQPTANRLPLLQRSHRTLP